MIIFRQTTSLLFILVLLSVSWQVMAQWTDQEYKAEYDVFIGETQIAVSQRSVLRGSNDVFISKHSITPLPLMALLGEKATSQTTFLNLEKNKVTVARSEIQEDGNSNKEVANFDWKNRQVKLSNDVVVTMPDGDVYDFEGWLLSIMLGLNSAPSGSKLSLFEIDKIYPYQVSKIESETTTIADQEYEVLNFEIVGTESGDRSYTVLLSPQLNHLPVKISASNDSTTLIFNLRSFEPNSS